MKEARAPRIDLAGTKRDAFPGRGCASKYVNSGMKVDSAKPPELSSYSRRCGE